MILATGILFLTLLGGVELFKMPHEQQSEVIYRAPLMSWPQPTYQAPIYRQPEQAGTKVGQQKNQYLTPLRQTYPYGPQPAPPAVAYVIYRPTYGQLPYGSGYHGGNQGGYQPYRTSSYRQESQGGSKGAQRQQEQQQDQQQFQPQDQQQQHGQYPPQGEASQPPMIAHKGKLAQLFEKLASKLTLGSTYQVIGEEMMPPQQGGQQGGYQQQEQQHEQQQEEYGYGEGEQDQGRDQLEQVNSGFESAEQSEPLSKTQAKPQRQTQGENKSRRPTVEMTQTPVQQLPVRAEEKGAATF